MKGTMIALLGLEPAGLWHGLVEDQECVRGLHQWVREEHWNKWKSTLGLILVKKVVGGISSSLQVSDLQ